jgi:outer membrane protein assembly factor BamB
VRRAISMCLGLTVWLSLPNALPATRPQAATAQAAATRDWPVWGGPTRDFKSPTTGLAASWPDTGPPRVWTRPLGEGFSAAAVEGSRLYTAYSTSGREIVAALDAATGKTIWEYAYETTFNEGAKDVGAGPYAMPQVIGDRVVSVGGTGKLHSLDKRTGKPVWSHDLLAEFGGDKLAYGYSCHALPYKNLLILLVGGDTSRAIVAFDQTDGRLVWGKHAFPNAHSSPVLIDVDGQQQVVALMRQQVVAFDPNSGDLLWEHPHPTQYLGVSTPIWGADQILVVSSAYGGGTRALHLTQQQGRTTVRELWHNSRLQVHFGTMIRIGETVYGASGESGPAPITAFDVKTGRVLWHTGRQFAKSQLLLADNKLVILDEDGVLALATPTATELTVHSRVQLLDKVAWTPPSLAGTTLYIRDRKNLMALDLGAH